MPSVLLHNVLDIGELRVVLVVLLVLRAVDCRIQYSFHGWCLYGDSIAYSDERALSCRTNNRLTDRAFARSARVKRPLLKT